ncbi:hypothetical protein KJ855_02780, partial [Patescibacteria group bacterium]|nr:hypothetical protein [Patescibacteria group bacterium]
MIEKIPSWARDAIIYHIYPLGYCDCPSINPIARTSPSIQNLQPINRICKIRDYYDYFRSLGINTIYLGPLFESCTHGYDVINYFQVDRRLGANQILKEIINELHSRQIKVILDGVFHHTSRLFPCFVDIKKYKQQSKFISWYQDIDFHKDTVWQDGFSYKTYLDHVELPVLNLHHPDTQKFIHKVSNFWIKEFDIDGWRLDVAHHITPVFWQNFE